MNTTRTLRIAAVAATLLAALSAQAADASQDTYRRVVLGDTSVQAPQAAEATERVVPGSYARYLIKNGVERSQALATARATGETPTVERAQSVASENLTGQALYERVLAVDANS